MCQFLFVFWKILTKPYGFNQSRSAKITQLIQQDLQDVQGLTVRAASTRNLIAALTTRPELDDTMKNLLLQVLTKAP